MYTFHVKAASNAIQNDWMTALDQYEAILYPNKVQKKKLKVRRTGTEWTKIWDELEAEKKAETKTEEEPAPGA